MPALPILKLPIIVLMKILRTIDIGDVFPISLCSRKMYHLVKNFRDKTIPLKLYWSDRVKGLQSIMEYLSDLFGIKKVTSVTVTPDTMRLLDIIKERQGNDYELVTCTYLSMKQSHFILENHPAKVIRISGLSPNFPIGKYLQTVDSLFVGSKVSITLDDLLNMNCVELVLVSNHFTGTEMKGILQHWAIGGIRRLKYLRLDVEDLNLEDVFGELTHTWMTEKRKYKYV
ncbi:hypothetical protein CRE_27812 [Caenorhabditis remanei]|uniref:F-box domain-containing protein n=1 Tax=Caenorhabditis remanei TaxID=31234 RepID=E3N5H1_CAERE|nr:hypothetical protein CRE_27812 [Caenorhabditis remanei]